MIIHQPTIKNHHGDVILSSRIEFENPLSTLPQNLWFSFPEIYAPYISDRGEAFLLSMLVPALYFNEDIDVRGDISPLMADNILEYIKIYRQFKSAPHHIDINFDKISEHRFAATPHAVVTPFSGGIDSMYTVWAHLPERELSENENLTHGIIIQGFDTFLYEQEYFNWVVQQYEEFLHSINLQLIQASTNLRQFSQYRIDWLVHHNPALKSFPFALGKLVARFYQPSTEGVMVNVIGDPLLSVESLQVSVHGAEMTRVEKIEKINAWKKHHHTVRVCIGDNKVVGQLNCQTCEKCLRTMISVQLAGVESSFPGFDYKPLPTQILKWWWKSKRTSISIRDFLITSRRHKQWGLNILFWILFIVGIVKDASYRFAVSLIPKRVLYRLKTNIFQGDEITEK